MTIRVFLVDDHTIVRDGLQSLLEGRSEIKVVGHASNGHMALNQLKDHQADVVLMDISMPELNGIEATRLILGLYPEVRIIILSMLGTSEHIYRALQAGASGYLLKDSAGREVMEAVLAVAAGKRYFSQSITNALLDDYMVSRAHKGEKGPLESLSQREFEIMQLVIDGKSSTEIGKILNLSPKTVESYRSRMMQKLGVANLPELIKFAMRAGLIS